MRMRVAIIGAACAAALTACASQSPKTGFVAASGSLAPCSTDQELVVSNLSGEAVRVTVEPTGDPHTSAASRGGNTELRIVPAGFVDTFPVARRGRAIWIEAVDQPRNPGGSYRAVNNVQFGCIEARN